MSDAHAKEGFTEAELQTLRLHYARVRLIDPSHMSYKQLCTVLDGATDEALQQLWNAQIHFVSMMARNRLLQRARERNPK